MRALVITALNWKNTTDDCGPAFITNTIGDGLAYSFKGTAVYVYGTIACGWAGLVNISVDDVFNATINRENCDAVPANGTRAICRYPWMSKDGLDPNVEHKLTVTLVGPSLRENPSGHVVAELRSIRYTVPITTSAAVASSTDDYNWTPNETTVTSAPTASSESADSPLPQLASLRLSTAATCGIIVGVVLFFLFALAVCIVLRRRSNQRRRQANMAGMIGPRSMVSQSRRHSRYPTEHLSWSPAAERLEEAKAQQAAGRRNSGGSFGSTGRSSWSRRRMDSIPESDWEPHNADHSSGPASLAGVIAGSSRSPRDEKGGFSWAGGNNSPPSSPGGKERKESERAAFYVSNSIPSPSTRLAFPSLAASGDYWSRRSSRSSGGRFAALPASPLRTSMVAEDGVLRPGS
ncbi:hypothetical protein FS837_010416 [Tulasnella sp. UAMH 9824]|nr:hypothetical protein FS837_010416 [Tulasnella sp. UAMH 9824]